MYNIRSCHFILLFVLLFTCFSCLAQVGIGTQSPNSSAVLDLTSNSKGFLPPRITSVQRNSIVSPATGLIIYNTTIGCLQVNNGTETKPIWSSYGNSQISATSNGTAVISSISCSSGQSGNLIFGQSAAGVTQTITVNVTKTGTYDISATSNGVTFSSSGNLTSTGSQNIVLTAQGIPTTGDLITFGFDLVATCSFTLPVGGVVAAGSTFTTFSNGTANFSTNSTCATSNISAGHNSNSCTGTVNGASTTYNLVLINGQCWIKENLKETPTSPCADAINTGCNTWNASTVPTDFGYWGYYNLSNSTGSAGWSSTETMTNGGLIYQWSAAMNGETAERARGVCPIGFHIPSDCEWMYLEHGLGMSISDQQATGARASGNVGVKISNVVTGGTNSSGFTALLPGNRNTTGTFANYNAVGVYWTSTTSSTNSFRRFFQLTYLGSNRGATVRHSTASVRCLKD